MQYAELLKNYIKKSGYTLDEISEKLQDKGLTATKQYLSRLQNGKNPPASEELNRAIAEVTGGNPDSLIMAGYLEKAPESVKALLPDVEITDEYLNQAMEAIVSFHSMEDDFSQQVIKSFYKFLRDEQIEVGQDVHFMNKEDIKTLPLQKKAKILKAFFTAFTVEEKVEFIKEYSSPKSIDELLQEKIDDPDDYFFLDGYLDASEEEKKRIRKYWYEIKKEMRENKVKATKPPSLFELTEDMDKGPNDE